MASGLSVDAAITTLDMLLSSDVDVRLWTVAPAFDGTGGTEVTGGGYAPSVWIGDPAVAGTGGQIAKKASSTSNLFDDMPTASTGIAAISFHTHSTGDLLLLDDSWTSPVAWSVGDSPLFAAGDLIAAIVPVS